MEDSTATSSSNSIAPGPSTFKPASAFLPPSTASSANTAGTLRNASNGADESSSSVDGATATAAASSMAANGETTTAAPAAQPAAPIKPVNRSASSKRAIIHSSVQRRNPVLGELQRLKQTTEIGDIPSDYQVGEHAGLLFLSLKYHRLHPEYIHTRIEKIKNRYKLRILMVLCDVNEHHLSIKELSKIAIHNDLTMMVAWSNDEVAQYIAQFKIYEHKSADTLKEKVHQQYREQLQHVLTTGKRVNKTDANNLASQFGSFTNIVHQQAKALSGVKGLGKTKVETLVDAFHKPFLVGGLKRKADAGEVYAFTSSVSGHPTAAVPESGAASSSNGRGEADRSKGKGKGKGKQRAEAGLEEEGEAEETPGSPDWPDEDIEDDEDAAREMAMDMDQEMIPSRRGRAPSRSPGLSPELQPTRERPAGDADESAWRDPLDDEEDDNEAGEDEDERANKRAKR